jgi:hypothetical protein
MHADYLSVGMISAYVTINSLKQGISQESCVGLTLYAAFACWLSNNADAHLFDKLGRMALRILDSRYSSLDLRSIRSIILPISLNVFNKLRSPLFSCIVY